MVVVQGSVLLVQHVREELVRSATGVPGSGSQRRLGSNKGTRGGFLLT